MILSLRQTKVENFVSYTGRLALTEGLSSSSVVGRGLPWLLRHLFTSLRTSNLEGKNRDLAFNGSLWKAKQRTDHGYVFRVLCVNLGDVHLVFCTSGYFLWAEGFTGKYMEWM